MRNMRTDAIVNQWSTTRTPTAPLVPFVEAKECFCHSARLRDRSPRLKLVLSDGATCGVFYLTDINMWYPMTHMTHMSNHQDFLKFEAVLAHCEKQAPEGSLFSAMEYGR